MTIPLLNYDTAEEGGSFQIARSKLGQNKADVNYCTKCLITILKCRAMIQNFDAGNYFSTNSSLLGITIVSIFNLYA